MTRQKSEVNCFSHGGTLECIFLSVGDGTGVAVGGCVGENVGFAGAVGKRRKQKWERSRSMRGSGKI
jgi:hypothetical protein